uniref:Transcriptional coactivator Hfi1/Transcriptional adapter 1 n=1 Tax=Davidia involucrata TaxID=16924 RepID=A0A5B7BR00_DAVIN
MQPQQNSRIDVADLKAQIVKKIGPERLKRYFYYLNRLLSKKLSKGEFDRLCFRVLGRENLPLHNQFVCSILKNACDAKTPPPVHDPTKSAGKSSPAEVVHEQSGSVVPNQTPSAQIWSNGVVMPMSPPKGRSAIRDWKLRDRPSPLGPNGKSDSVSHQSMATEDCGVKTVMENGSLTPCDYQRPMQHPQGLAEQPDNGRPRIKKSTDALVSVSSKDQIEAAVVEDGEEVEQDSHFNISRSPLVAPLGIPFWSESAGVVRKALPASTSSVVSYFDSGGLSDTETLRKRLEQIAAAEGLGGVSMECANMLNNMLDVYLKRLIRSCVELAGARSAYELKKHPAHKQQQIQGKLINGMWLSNHLHMQSSGGPAEVMQEQRPCCSISLLDFKVAMKLNPQQLGEDWPLLLEKICMHAFEE